MSGKLFEKDIEKSCEKQNIKWLRLKDAPNAFSFGGDSTKNIRFTQSSPYDAEIYKFPYNLCCELKSTKGTSFSTPIDEKDNTKMIKAKQIKGLKKVNNFQGVFPGFIFNFRENNNNTYFMSINSFLEFYENTTKRSINENDIISYKDTIKIENQVKKVHYIYDINKLFEEIE